MILLAYKMTLTVGAEEYLLTLHQYRDYGREPMVAERIAMGAPASEVMSVAVKIVEVMWYPDHCKLVVVPSPETFSHLAKLSQLETMRRYLEVGFRVVGMEYPEGITDPDLSND